MERSAPSTGRMTVREYAEDQQMSVQSVYKQIRKGKLQTATEKINGRDVLFILLDEPQQEGLNHLTHLTQSEGEKVVNHLTQIKPEVDNHLNQKEGELNQSVNQLNQSEGELVEEVVNQLNPSLNSGLKPFNPPIKPDAATEEPEQEQEQSSVLQLLQEQLREKDKQIERLQEQNRQQAEESRKKDEIITDQLSKMNELLRNSQLLQAQVNNLLLQGKTGDPEDGDQTPAEAEAAPVPDEQTPEPQKKRRGFFYRLFFGED